MNSTQLTHSAHQPRREKFPLCYLAHDIDTPANIGSLFRIADALGVEKIWLSGSSPTPPNAKIKKTARSAEKYVAYEYQRDPLAVIEELKSRDYRIISLEITSTSVDLKTLPVKREEKICLILGAENTGVCQSLLDASDACVHIPMLGNNSSMNVANACAIATYELLGRIA